LNNTNYAERDWAEFTHRPGERYTDFNRVKDEIEAETERVAGKNKDIST
jgi:dynamin 1-like protein